MEKLRITDTHPKMQRKFDEIMAARTPEERVLMGVSMFQASKLMILERLKRENPQAKMKLLRTLLLKELYGLNI